jgi:hypothetical protein
VTDATDQRGLGAYAPDLAPDLPDATTVRISLNELHPGDENPRERFDDVDDEDLIVAVKEQIPAEADIGEGGGDGA